MTGRVSWISLTAVKALAVEQVDEIDVLEQGLRGDRRFYLVDERGRLVNNKGKRGPLQLIHAGYDEPTEALTLSLPDGSSVSERAVLGDTITTTFHRRPKEAQRVEGPWDAVLSEAAGEPVRLVAAAHGAPDRGRGGAVSLLAQSSLDAIAGHLGVTAIDDRRFRMNVGIEGVAAHAEDEWIGRRIRVGDAVVVPQGNIGRCAITTQNPETGLADLDTLGALAEYRAGIEASEPLPFGVHAAVAQAGRVRVGDTVEPE